MLAGIFVFSCKRQKIYEPELLTANIPILIDWTKSLVDADEINSVSIYFYPQDGSAPSITYSNDPFYAIASLREGVYDIIIHNEIAGNIKGIDCIDSEKAFDYRLLSQKDNADNYQMFYKPTPNNQLIKESEPVAAWSYKGFEVTRDMIEYTRTRSFDELIATLRSKAATRSSKAATKAETKAFIDGMTKAFADALYTKSDDPVVRSVTKVLEDLNGVEPIARTSTYNVTLKIRNLNNAQYIENVLDCFVDEAEMFSGAKTQTIENRNNYTYFKMTEPVFDKGSTTDGTISYTFSNLGHKRKKISGVKYMLYINIILHSGEKFSYTFDVTDQILDYEVDEVIKIYIGSDGLLEGGGNPEIVLPPNADAGFGVADWGDATDVIL